MKKHFEKTLFKASVRASLTGLLCTLSLLMFASLTQAKPVAEATFDLSTGLVCFPLELLSNNQTYDTCLSLMPGTGGQEFSLARFKSREYDLANMPYYDQDIGVWLPLVRLSNGRVYSDVLLDVALDSSTGKYSFSLLNSRRLQYAFTESKARIWNDALLDSIRNDLARPTVHARNLFHTAVVMYDAWAAFDSGPAETYMLGKSLQGSSCSFDGISFEGDITAAQDEAISYASYKLLKHRFANTPDAALSLQIYEDLMLALGYDTAIVSTDYANGSPAALGNYIAQCMIAYGLSDGANESNNYANLAYQAQNQAMFPEQSGNTTMTDPDRWQPLSFEVFRDQSGNVFSQSTPAFVSPEWGNVLPFALSSEDLSVLERDGTDWKVYHDPGSQSLLKEESQRDSFQWNFELVALWSSHLDASDGVLWDISPGANGNIGGIEAYPDPQNDMGMREFYNQFNGGDPSRGYEVNPVTGLPYEPQWVPRGDYVRVLAEFWADGPDSETPPGHWFTLFNHVSEHPLLEKRIGGTGAVVSDLEWDVKGYLAMGGAMHDSAITAWGIKGYYDSSRPVSTIRYMAEQGQRSDPALPNYNLEGLKLIPGYIEQVTSGDPLAGENDANVGKIKLYAWKGPDFIMDATIDEAGVGWILAENWWPYQRPTFVSPPFAGYISGHSTYSRAAAEVMALYTGDPYFPGGMSDFKAPKNEFLVFEEGPSMDIVLQWATYQDASDQTSLSRIWGGIHPPMDDMPGRFIGIEIGNDAYQKAASYFEGNP